MKRPKGILAYTRDWYEGEDDEGSERVIDWTAIDPEDIPDDFIAGLPKELISKHPALSAVNQESASRRHKIKELELEIETLKGKTSEEGEEVEGEEPDNTQSTEEDKPLNELLTRLDTIEQLSARLLEREERGLLTEERRQIIDDAARTLELDNLPPEAVNAISGSTVEEMQAQATAVISLIKSVTKETEDFVTSPAYGQRKLENRTRNLIKERLQADKNSSSNIYSRETHLTQGGGPVGSP